MAIDITAEKIGKLGYGNMRLPKTADGEIDYATINSMIDMYMEAGFNYYDTGYIYQGSEEVLGECLVKRYPRDSFFITTKLSLTNVTAADQMPIQIETSLKRLGLDYVDCYFLHGLNKDTIAKADKFGAWEYLQKLKAEGKTRHIGFSFHDTPEVLDELLTAHPEVELVQLQLNYLDWENPDVQARRLYETARKHNKPISVMEPNKGGWLAGEASESGKLLKSKNPDVTAASWAFRYLIEKEGLLVILSGMGNTAELADNIKTFKNFTPLTAEEHEVIQEAVKIINATPNIPCTRCGYCMPNCPQKIAIPGYIGILNNFYIYRNFDTIEHIHFMVSGEGSSPADCLKCGSCERHCPQHLSIMDYLAKCEEIVKGGKEKAEQMVF